MPPELIDQPNVPWTTAAQIRQLAWFSSFTDTDVPTLNLTASVASTWLWRASGRQFSGPGSTTVRPVCQCNGTFGFGRLGWSGNPSWYFDSRGGRFSPWGFGSSRGEGAFEVLLGHTPVRSVDQVVIEGAVFPASTGGVPNYRLDDARWLVRTDGQAWPSWQEWANESGLGALGDQTSTWEVLLTWGEDPPPDGIYAATILAGELALAATQSGECRLPRNVQSVTRQGTSMLMMDPTILLAAGKWGIPEVDFFVQSTNPAGLQQPATMTSPDIPRAVRRAGTLPGS